MTKYKDLPAVRYPDLYAVMVTRDSVFKVLAEVARERERQDAKWGEQNHNPERWMLILAEEFGEASKEANEITFRGRNPANYRQELLQTAAVCVAAIEALDRQTDTKPPVGQL